MQNVNGKTSWKTHTCRTEKEEDVNLDLRVGNEVGRWVELVQDHVYWWVL
jgi:hypothetical protein